MAWTRPRFHIEHSTGAKIPAVGMGTFGSDRLSALQVAEAVKGPYPLGRHIDCASVYGNQHLIGEVLQEVMEAGIKERTVDYL